MKANAGLGSSSGARPAISTKRSRLMVRCCLVSSSSPIVSPMARNSLPSRGRLSPDHRRLRTFSPHPGPAFFDRRRPFGPPLFFLRVLTGARLLADVHDSVAALDQCARIATNAVELLIVLPAVVAGPGSTPKDPNGRAVRAAGHPTPRAARVVGPDCVPRETRLVLYVGIKEMVRGDIETPRLSVFDRQANGEQRRKGDSRHCDCQFSQHHLLHRFAPILPRPRFMRDTSVAADL